MVGVRFLCDEMLGRLARDLRLLGYDVAYARGGGDAAILRRALAEERLLLTRDRRLAAEAGAHAFLVHAHDPAAQIHEAVAGLGLVPDEAAFLSRCTRCGGALDEVAAAAHADALPPDVPRRHACVHRCRACGHLYWPGSHTAHIRARLGMHLKHAQSDGARMSPADEPRIRSLTLKDVDRILEIDAAVTKTPVKQGDNDLWRLIAETTTCFGAEEDGKLMGFVLADIRPWEFGRRAHVGWIIALGVDPLAQGQGLGRLLGERVMEQFHRLGVSRVQTIVEPGTNELETYFKALGFKESPTKVLVRDLDA